MLCHLTELSESKVLQDLLPLTNAKFALNVFFVISGFLVSKSFESSISLKSYFIRRLKRVIPGYIVALSVFVLVLSFFSRLSFTEYFTDKGTGLYLFWNLIFLNFVHPCLPGVFENNFVCAVNGALWTIKVEEGFYIVLPVIFYLIKKTRKPLLFLAFIYLVSVAYSYVMLYHYNNPRLAKQLPGSMMYFSTGIFLYLNFKYLYAYRWILFGCSSLVLYFNSIFELNVFVLQPLFFGICIITSAYCFTYFKNFGKYGDFTYGIYIYHFPIIQITRHLDLYNKYNPYFVGVSVMITVFILAFLSWNLVEKRFLDRFKTKSIVLKPVGCN